MKLIVKTLSGKQLEINVETDWTIAKVKAQIETDHKMDAAALKLIAYGKVLDKDENLVSDHALKDGDNIVAMVQKAKKPKAEPPKAEPPKAADPVPVPVAAEATNNNADANANPPASNPPQPAPAQANPPQPGANAGATTITLTDEEQNQVNELMSISGADLDKCKRAFIFARKNPDVAFEVLLSGANIPTEAQLAQAVAGGDAGPAGG